MNDVLLNKKVSLERCLHQVAEYYRREGDVPFEHDHLRRDAIAMNLQRACELTIDMANHLVKSRKLGLPQDSKDSFRLLQHEGLIDAHLSEALQAMVGFRNILVHQYTELDPGAMREVIEQRTQDLRAFADIAVSTSV